MGLSSERMQRLPIDCTHVFSVAGNGLVLEQENTTTELLFRYQDFDDRKDYDVFISRLNDFLGSSKNVIAKLYFKNKNNYEVILESDLTVYIELETSTIDLKIKYWPTIKITEMSSTYNLFSDINYDVSGANFLLTDNHYPERKLTVNIISDGNRPIKNSSLVNFVKAHNHAGYIKFPEDFMKFGEEYTFKFATILSIAFYQMS